MKENESRRIQIFTFSFCKHVLFLAEDHFLYLFYSCRRLLFDNFACGSRQLFYCAMRKKEEKNAIIEICPVRNVIARFGNKWALLVILILSENKVLRFNELGRLIPDVSSRVLSGTLRTLEADGLVERTVYPTVPPKVEYRLTETGASLVPFIVQLTEWAQKHIKSIIRHREKFEAAEK